MGKCTAFYEAIVKDVTTTRAGRLGWYCIDTLASPEGYMCIMYIGWSQVCKIIVQVLLIVEYMVDGGQDLREDDPPGCVRL